MFGSDVIDVGIGMSLLFLMMSLIATSIREGIESLMKSRAGDLEKGLREMFDQQDRDGKGVFAGPLKALYEHPLISSLYRGKLEEAKKARDLPSYIPSKAFVSALLDVVLTTPTAAAAVPGQGGAPVPDAAPAPAAAAPQRMELSIPALRFAATQVDNERIRRVLVGAIDEAQGDVDAVRKSLEAWFDSTMDRVSGWYRRRTQSVLFAIGLGAAILLNVDSITILARLTVDKTLREAVVATAQTPPCKNAEDCATPKSYDQISKELKGMGYPIGWVMLDRLTPYPQMCTGDLATIEKTFAAEQAKKAADAEAARKAAAAKSSGAASVAADSAAPTLPAAQPGAASADKPGSATAGTANAQAVPGCIWDGWMLFRIFIGWLVTAFAIMLGAPFWFDVLNKFMVVRSTIKPHEKSKEEASKDSQTSPAPTRADATGAAGGSGTPAAGAAAPVPFEERLWKPDVASDSREGIV